MCPQKSAIFFPKKVEVKGYFKILQKFIKFCIDRPIKLQGPWSKHQPNNSTRPHRKLRRTRSWKGSTRVLPIPRGATFLASLRHPATSAIYNTKCFSTVFTNAIQLFIVSRSTQHVNWHPLHWSICQALISTFLKHNFQAAADRHAHLHHLHFHFH